MLAAEPAVLAELKLLRLSLLVLRRGVVSLLALGAGERNDISHCNILLYELDILGATKGAGNVRLIIQ
jgi:hypothetical protein